MKPLDYAVFAETGQVLSWNAKRLDKSFASGLRPPPRVSVAEWAPVGRHFPDGAPIEGKYDHNEAPELWEMQEVISPHHFWCEEVVIIKCAQSGGSVTAENWIGHMADSVPGPAIYVAPILRSAEEWAAEKLWPMIEASPRLNPAKGGAVLPIGEGGSSKWRIRFRRGGWLLLAGANSAATLRQHTVRFAIEDDLDQFPDDLDKQGSPEAMVDARLKVYRTQGLSKRLKISTPRVAGASKIAAAYARSDRRRYYLKCVGCGCRFDPIWEASEEGQRDIHWPEGRPQEAYLVAPCCGAVIEHWQKPLMKTRDGWLSTIEVDGEKPPRHMSEDEFQARRAAMPRTATVGYHITGIISRFTTWGDLATSFVAAKGDPNKLKGWVNLDLGDVYDVKGDAPDYERLKGLIEQDWGKGRRLPWGALAATMGVDVQGDGVYFTIIVWGANAESWTYEAAFVPGATDIAGEGAWRDLDAICRRKLVYPGGKEFAIDQVCVDAGYHTEAATAFCKGHANRLAVFGRPGWTLPILGRGEITRYETQGKYTGKATKRLDDRAYLVGTYGVKLSLYGFLRQTLAAHEAALAGAPVQARGLCHFGQDLPTDYFEQLTSETVETRVVNGYPRREWRPIASRPNHYLDCRVYAHAAAEKLKLDSMTEADWAALATERCSARDPNKLDLFDQPLSAPAGTAAPDANPVREGGWVETQGDWL